MKNIYDVLRNKEAELHQLQKEVEALRIAARLLTDEAPGAEVRPVATSVPTALKPGAATVPVGSGEKHQTYSAVWDNAPRQFP